MKLHKAYIFDYVYKKIKNGRNYIIRSGSKDDIYSIGDLICFDIFRKSYRLKKSPVYEITDVEEACHCKDQYVWIIHIKKLVREEK